jgi:ATP-binding cassette, subfamily B, bacterial
MRAVEGPPAELRIGRLRRLRKFPVGQLWPGIKPFAPKGRSELAAIGVSAVVTGFAQAGILYLLVEVAVSLAQGNSRLTGSKSSILGSLHVSTSTAILFGLILVVVMAVASVVQARLTAKIMSGVQTQARHQLVDSFLQASWSSQSNARIGHLQELASTFTTRTADGAGCLALWLISLFNFLALIVAAVIVNPVATAVILAGTILVSLLLRPLVRLTKANAWLQSTSNARFSVKVAEIVRLAQDMRVFNAGDRVKKQVDDVAREAEDTLTKTRFLLRVGPGIYQSVAFGLVLAAMAVIDVAHIGGVASLGAVVLFLVRGLSYSQQVQNAHQSSAEIVTYIEQVQAQITEFRADPVVDGTLVLSSLRTVEFSHVGYSYDGVDDVLADISFAVRPGEAIGIVGPSGAGKSTLVQLLLRLRQPVAGAFLVNGVGAADFRLSDFYREVTFVPQEPRLIRGTTADNIRFFREQISDADVRRAAADANLVEDIEAWEGGFDREIGDGAADLSGGQKQRIAIARALAGRPSLIILDEPTSSLDPRSDHLVLQALNDLKGEATLVIVAHRLSTLGFCDRIMVLEGGRITALGPPDELAQTNAFLRDSRRLSTLP